jgi:fructose-1,6-bisphosphatase/inositol monophosphatase family enzyme
VLRNALGGYLDPRGAVRTSGKKEVDRKTVVAVEGYESRRQIKRFEDIFENAWVKDFGTSALELAGVACGMFDAFIHPRHKKDELPAGYLLIKEAGGCITDFEGKPIDDKPYVYEKSARQDVIASATPELGRELSRMIGN